jgi:hypothetical protein
MLAPPVMMAQVTVSKDGFHFQVEHLGVDNRTWMSLVCENLRLCERME